VKEQVLDMSGFLKVVNEKMDCLTNKVASLTRQLDVVTTENIALRKKVVVLESRLAKYETPPKDSHNSHTPPSKESIKAQALRATRSLREKSNNPTGGQKGHKGNTLEKAPEPDAIEEHQPHYCTQCGEDLSHIEGSIVEARQSIDIPLPIRPIITEHRAISKECSCGHCNRIEFPKTVRSNISYGVNTRALVAYLSNVQHLPYQRLTELLDNCFGVKMSQGTVYNILQDMKQQTRVAYDQIRNKIEQAKVVGADETGENINGKLHWMWVWQTPDLTYIHSDKFRGKLAIDNQFKDGLPKATLVTDRHSSYFNMVVKDHQLCLTHLLRELAYLSELSPDQTWSSRMAELLREAIHKRKTENWEHLDRKSILERFANLLATATNHLHQKIIALHKSLIKHKESMFRFLFDPDIPYDNNASERAVRPLKVKQKVSGLFRSDQGADAFCQLHSITQTAKKNNQNPFSALIAVANNI
jgi:transposase